MASIEHGLVFDALHAAKYRLLLAAEDALNVLSLLSLLDIFLAIIFKVLASFDRGEKDRAQSTVLEQGARGYRR